MLMLCRTQGSDDIYLYNAKSYRPGTDPMTAMPDPTAPTLGFLLNDVARLLRKRFEQNAGASGLTRAQWQVLAYLSHAEGISQGGLADILEVEPITLARQVDRLEAADLVERRPHPSDRRIKRLYLRPAALPILGEMRAVGEATRAEALAGLSEEDRERLGELLSTMKNNLVQLCGTSCRQKELAHD